MMVGIKQSRMLIISLVFNFFDGYNSHWDDNALDEMKVKHIHSCLLKVGDSENDQANNNGPNIYFKYFYNGANAIWDEKFGTTNFTPSHMNQVVAHAWKIFTLKSAPIIVNSFDKTNLHPLQPPKAVGDITISAD